MSTQEKNAREYCLSIGADPDELVWGYQSMAFGDTWLQRPRYLWYIGAEVGQ